METRTDSIYYRRTGDTIVSVVTHRQPEPPCNGIGYVNAVSSYLWPIAFVIFVFVFKAEIIEVLQKIIKAEVGNLKIELNKEVQKGGETIEKLYREEDKNGGN
jgi:hypothetical protein